MDLTAWSELRPSKVVFSSVSNLKTSHIGLVDKDERSTRIRGKGVELTVPLIIPRFPYVDLPTLPDNPGQNMSRDPKYAPIQPFLHSLAVKHFPNHDIDQRRGKLVQF